MKKTLLALALLATTATQAQANPADLTRRTLHAYAGQTAVVFEAPEDMCFFDVTDFVGGIIISHSQVAGGVLQGVFSSCENIANFDHPDINEKNPVMGTIHFLEEPAYRPLKGETRSAYLRRTGEALMAEQRAKVEKQLIEDSKIDKGTLVPQAVAKEGVRTVTKTQTALQKFNAEPVRVSENAVMQGSFMQHASADESQGSASVMGLLFVRGAPEIITVSRPAKEGEPFGDLYDLLSDMIEAQIALNGDR